MTGKINILNLIDFEEVDKCPDGFNQSTRSVTTILDLKGNVLSKSGWRQICTQFHGINPETAKNCIISDIVLINELGNEEKYHFYIKKRVIFCTWQARVLTKADSVFC